MAEKITQTVGRDVLGQFAPDFARYNDDIIFGENWNNTDISLKTRCMITVVALVSSGIADDSLKFHLNNAKKHGVTQKEIAAVLTHTAFYVGWPKAWAAFRIAKDIWDLDDDDFGMNEEPDLEPDGDMTEDYPFHAILEFGLGDFTDTEYVCKVSKAELKLIQDAKQRKSAFDEDDKCKGLYARIRQEIHDQEEERYLDMMYDDDSMYDEDEVVPFDEIIFYVSF
ncbi:MAG: carboxymuconolactone decarboxylase family protein [Eubacterium sp.]|nr:carboxymuconolactone decarboxylase family protein [Eubacterium sp.]